jgi:predicted HD superfamily hydrolase involved in NAD metabolism
MTNTHLLSRAIADKYLPFLASLLTPPRLQHSLGVMRVMGELTGIYKLDRTRALLAGLLHDAARDMHAERQLALAKEAQIKFQHECERHPVYLHAPVGAYVVFTELDITDDLVLGAIATHADSGDKIESDLRFQWCLQAADLLAPVSEWHGMKKFKDIVYAGRLPEAALLRCGWLAEYFEKTGVPIHPNLKKKYQLLSDRLQVTEPFFDRW